MQDSTWLLVRAFVVGGIATALGAVLVITGYPQHFRADPAMAPAQQMALWGGNLMLEYVLASVIIFGVGYVKSAPSRTSIVSCPIAGVLLVVLGVLTTSPWFVFHWWIHQVPWYLVAAGRVVTACMVGLSGGYVVTVMSKRVGSLAN